MAYEAFADIYDAFNEDADYVALHRAIMDELHAYGIAEGIIADLGCGTGDLTLLLAQDGYDMIGIDRSEEMLSILREKAEECGVNSLLLLCQSLEELDLYGTVRAVVSTFDTMNHVGPLALFRQAVARAALFLEPDGIFVFDMNTPYKHREILADHVYEMEAEDVFCVWRNAYDPVQRRTHITIDMSYPGQDEHDVEEFDEYAYTLDEIKDACRCAGLRICEVRDGETFGPLTEHSARFLITAAKLQAKKIKG